MIKEKRTVICFLVLLVCILGLFVLNICIGSVNIPFCDVVDILIGKINSDIYKEIIIQIRLPRIAAVFFLGGALALSGYLLQTFFRNPIAGPFVLGISSGAKLFVALVMVFSLRYGIKITSGTMALSAFMGAAVSMIFVLAAARVVEKSAMLIVTGVMIGYICSAITDLVINFANDSNIANIYGWSMGSFSGINWEQVKTISIIVITGFTAAYLLSKPISAYIIGEVYAGSMGVNITLFRFVTVILSSVLAGCVTAFAGPVSFVGIAVPHIIKGFFKSSKPIIMIPSCFLGGSAFCLLCDFLSRMLASPSELSISTVTAVLGAPVVLYVIVKRRKAY